jgi:hypothetical protein
MAVVTVSGSPVVGTKYTVTTASSADWSSVSNSTYFFDLTDKLVHYKDSTTYLYYLGFRIQMAQTFGITVNDIEIIM